MEAKLLSPEQIFAAIEAEIKLALHDIGGVLVKRAYKLFREQQHYATRDLMSSLVYDIFNHNRQQFTLKLGSAVPYAKYVHEGRLPGKFPPVDKIKDWIKVKGLQLPAKPEDPEKALNCLAYLIGRKIARNGVKPFPFLRTVVQNSKALIEARVERYLNEVDKHVQP